MNLNCIVFGVGWKLMKFLIRPWLPRRKKVIFNSKSIKSPVDKLLKQRKPKNATFD